MFDDKRDQSTFTGVARPAGGTIFSTTGSFASDLAATSTYNAYSELKKIKDSSAEKKSWKINYPPIMRR